MCRSASVPTSVSARSSYLCFFVLQKDPSYLCFFVLYLCFFVLQTSFCRTTHRHGGRNRGRARGRTTHRNGAARDKEKEEWSPPAMEWLRLIGSLKLWVSCAEYSLFYGALLQKRPVILRSLLHRKGGRETEVERDNIMSRHDIVSILLPPDMILSLSYCLQT